MRWLDEDQVLVGPGVLARAGNVLERVSAVRAMVVTDGGLAASPVLSMLLDAVAGQAHVTVFDGVRPNPTVDVIDRAGHQAAEASIDAVIALGGGSSMDAAKGIALVAANPTMSAREFDYSAPPPHAALPILAVPTTAGTGSETNSWGVIDDPVSRSKIYIGDSSTVPFASLLDPLVTVGLPTRPSAATGFDALTHGIESLTSIGASDAGRAMSREAITQVSRYLPAAVLDGSDIQARTGMLIGAHVAGKALTQSGLGLAHGIAHAISAHTGAAHGEALAACLPEVIEFNMPVSANYYREVGQCMADGGWAAGADVPASVAQFAEETGARRSFGDLGLHPDMVASVALGASTDRVTSNNPRPVDPEDVEGILRSRL